MLKTCNPLLYCKALVSHGSTGAPDILRQSICEFTVPIGNKILGVKNARAWVPMVSYLKK